VPQACHSQRPDRFRADNHGQRHGALDQRRSPSSQVTTAPELALGAGGRQGRVKRMIEVTVHDGRVGRDPTRVTPEGHGEVLQTFESDRPIEEGEVLTLDDGTRVKVIGVTETLAPGSWKQAVHVGDLL
jgi:hypothetical protein